MQVSNRVPRAATEILIWKTSLGTVLMQTVLFTLWALWPCTCMLILTELYLCTVCVWRSMHVCLCVNGSGYSLLRLDWRPSLCLPPLALDMWCNYARLCNCGVSCQCPSEGPGPLCGYYSLPWWRLLQGKLQCMYSLQWRYSTWSGVLQYCIALHCIALHCIVLYCISTYTPYFLWRMHKPVSSYSSEQCTKKCWVMTPLQQAPIVPLTL